jgi:ADP-ribose pyrophosphatase YjhB (NUDIX family)
MLLRRQWAGEGRLVVFVARPIGRGNYDDTTLIDWHDRVFDIADVVIRWWPDDADPLSGSLGPDGQRMVLGASPNAPNSGYLFTYATVHTIAAATSLPGTVEAALGKIGSGARRTAGEREVPLSVWRADSFQRWYAVQVSAGNFLLGARRVWIFDTGSQQGSPLYWALQVRIFVRAENRVKSNDVVISRPDISAMALYQRRTSIDDTVIVLVREFRSSASTPDGFVHELPSGSGSGYDPFGQALSETEEETGLAVDVRRIRAHGSRQIAATVSAHHAHLFSAEITTDELARLHATRFTPHGTDHTERTWIEIATFGELRRSRLVDWATLGMIIEAVMDDPNDAS